MTARVGDLALGAWQCGDGTWTARVYCETSDAMKGGHATLADAKAAAVRLALEVLDEMRRAVEGLEPRAVVEKVASVSPGAIPARVVAVKGTSSGTWIDLHASNGAPEVDPGQRVLVVKVVP